MSRSACGITIWLLTLAHGAWASPISYLATPIGSLGGSRTNAQEINASGQVVGSSTLPGDHEGHAFLYSAGTLTDLAPIFGASSGALAINNSGQILGFGTGGHYLLYSNGAEVDFSSFPFPGVAAAALNNAGQVAGFVSSTRTTSAFLYADGSLMVLPAPFNNTQGVAINSKGDVLGTYEAGGSVFFRSIGSFLYSGGTVTDLGFFGNNYIGQAEAFNDAGEIVANVEDTNNYLSTNKHYSSVLYNNGVVTTLWSGSVNAINNSGKVVGTTCSPNNSNCVALLYSDGMAYDLNTLVASGLPSGVSLANATGINDNAWIIAQGSDNQAYLLTSVPEPQSAALVLMGFVALGIFYFPVRKRAELSRPHTRLQ